jgi:hypothetical protein
MLPWAIPPALFVLVTFEIRSQFTSGPVWTTVLLFVFLQSCMDGRCVPLYPVIGWDGSLVNILAELASNHDYIYPHLLSSWDYRLEPLCLPLIPLFSLYLFSALVYQEDASLYINVSFLMLGIQNLLNYLCLFFKLTLHLIISFI